MTAEKSRGELLAILSRWALAAVAFAVVLIAPAASTWRLSKSGRGWSTDRMSGSARSLAAAWNTAFASIVVEILLMLRTESPQPPSEF